MPTYTYRCANCSYHFDMHLRFEDPDPDRCPNCGQAGQIQRVYKPVGVVFKGSGFYATDNKSSSVLPANGKEGSTEDGAKGKSETSADSSSKTKSEPSTDSKKTTDSSSTSASTSSSKSPSSDT